MAEFTVLLRASAIISNHLCAVSSHVYSQSYTASHLKLHLSPSNHNLCKEGVIALFWLGMAAAACTQAQALYC